MIGKTNSQTGGSIKGEKLNISLTTNQSSHSDLMGAVITVTHPGGATNYTWEGYEITVDVPPYVDYSVAYSAVNGYKTPDTFTSTAVADNSRTITGTYQTEIVSVTASADDSASVNGVTITINGTEHTYSGSAITQKVPFGTQYSVSASDKTNYATPATQTFTAGQVSRSVSMVYTASKLTVNIASNQTNDTTISAVKATVAYGSISVQVSNGETIGIPVNTDVTVTYPAVTGYKTPDVVTVNNTGGTKTASGTYYTEVVTVTLSADNSADVSGQVVTINGTDYTWAGSAISVKIPYDTTYTVSVSDKDGYTTPASQTFTASQSGRNLEMVYVYNPYGVFLLSNDGVIHDVNSFSGDVNTIQDILLITENGKYAIKKSTQYNISLFDYDQTVFEEVEDIYSYCDEQTLSSALADLDGYGRTSKIYNSYGATINKSDYYIPTLGQMQIIYNNIDAILLAADKCGGNIPTYNLYWSSNLAPKQYSSDFTRSFVIAYTFNLSNGSTGIFEASSDSQYILFIRDYE